MADEGHGQGEDFVLARMEAEYVQIERRKDQIRHWEEVLRCVTEVPDAAHDPETIRFNISELRFVNERKLVDLRVIAEMSPMCRCFLTNVILFDRPGIPELSQHFVNEISWGWVERASRGVPSANQRLAALELKRVLQRHGVHD